MTNQTILNFMYFMNKIKKKNKKLPENGEF